MPAKTFLKLSAAAVLFLVSLLGSMAFAQQAPPVLFHWTSAAGLNRWNQLIVSENEFRFKPLLMSGFTSAYPQFEGKDGIFAWTDVATGTGAFVGNVIEWYARENRDKGDAARLVALFLEPGTRVVTLETYIRQSPGTQEIVETDPRANSPEVMNAGIIFHRIIDIDTKEIYLQEYVITKRRILSGMTAAPADIAPYIDAALNRLQDPTPYPQSALHSVQDNSTAGLNSPRTRKFVAARLERAKQTPSTAIPKFFRSNGTIPPPPSGAGSGACPLFF